MGSSIDLLIVEKSPSEQDDMEYEALSGITGQRLRSILKNTNVKSVHFTYLYKCRGKVYKAYKNDCYEEFLSKELEHYTSKVALLCGKDVCKFFGLKSSLKDGLGDHVQLYDHDAHYMWSIRDVIGATKKEKQFLEIINGRI